jgi:hypothetical protein
MKRSELKQILKECLMEILTEEPAVKQVFVEAARNKKPVQSKPTQPAKPNPNAKNVAKQIAGYDEDEETDPMLMESINVMAAQASGGNKKQAQLMQAIFADTALNTLPMQKEVANGVAAGQVMGDMNSAGVDLDELALGGDMTRWANISFTKK